MDDEKRQQLITFIQNTFREYDLERGLVELDEVWSFLRHKEGWDFSGNSKVMSVEYKAFLDYQRTCLNKLSGRELDHLLAILSMIEDKDLCIMDKEDMGAWNASGFCFNKEGKLVIFHER